MYFGFQFAKAAKTLPGYAVRHYVDTLATDPEALHASFAIYRALDATIAQNEERRTRRLTLPVLAIGGAEGIGEGAANTMRLNSCGRRAERGHPRLRPLLLPRRCWRR